MKAGWVREAEQENAMSIPLHWQKWLEKNVAAEWPTGEQLVRVSDLKEYISTLPFVTKVAYFDCDEVWLYWACEVEDEELVFQDIDWPEEWPEDVTSDFLKDEGFEVDN